MKPKETNNGKRGGLLKGKPHYSKDGKPLGGIKAIVTDTSQPVELEGGEVIINKEASKKHWKELSRINQSAGGGVPIHPPDGADDDVDENDFGRGGKVIVFRKNHIPKGFIYNYAKKIKEQYPEVWDMGGNIFGNEAYKNLERVYLRGYWLESEEWMYKKWQAFNARHSGDIRIAGIIANLKWLNVVDKGWAYMKNLIEDEIAKKYPEKKAKGGVVTYKNKYNKKYGYDKDESHTLNEVAKDTGKSKKGLQQIYNKGIGAYKTNPESVRPQVKSKEQWAMARVYSAVMGGKAAKVDAKELKMDKGGELRKGIKVEREHISTARKLYKRKITPEQAAESVAREHISEDPKYYSKLMRMKLKKGANIIGGKDALKKMVGGKGKLAEINKLVQEAGGSGIDLGTKKDKKAKTKSTTSKPTKKSSASKSPAVKPPSTTKTAAPKDAEAALDLFLNTTATDVKEKPIAESMSKIIENFEKVLQMEGKYKKIVRNK